MKTYQLTQRTRGTRTPLFAIADAISFVCEGVVDEVDINRIKVGQPVIISNDAIPAQSVTGRIVTVSSEATQQGNGEPESFGIRVAFKPTTDAQRQAIQLGMSARMSVQIYKNPGALVQVSRMFQPVME